MSLMSGKLSSSRRLCAGYIVSRWILEQNQTMSCSNSTYVFAHELHCRFPRFHTIFRLLEKPFCLVRHLSLRLNMVVSLCFSSFGWWYQRFAILNIAIRRLNDQTKRIFFGQFFQSLANSLEYYKRIINGLTWPGTRILLFHSLRSLSAVRNWNLASFNCDCLVLCFNVASAFCCLITLNRRSLSFEKSTAASKLRWSPGCMSSSW